MKSVVKELPPADFALVMATGIISIASHSMGLEAIARFLFWLNILFFISLLLLTIGRIIFFRQSFISDMCNHGRGVGYLTVVAAASIMGSQFIVLRNDFKVAFFLFVFGLVVWVVLIYAIFTVLAVRAEKPTLGDGINGIWLISAVSTQSLSILSSMLVYDFPGYRPLLLFFSFSMFLTGCMLYILIITLIFYRIMFFQLTPEDWGRPYWINMGAVAVTTLAGAMPPTVPGLPFGNGSSRSPWGLRSFSCRLRHGGSLCCCFWMHGDTLPGEGPFSMTPRTGEWYSPSACIPSAPFNYSRSPEWSFCSIFHDASSTPH